MELPKGLPGIPGSGPEPYAVAMARPRSLSLTPIGDHPGASFIQIDAEGTVRHVHLGSGPGTEERLESEIDALLSLGGQTGRR